MKVMYRNDFNGWRFREPMDLSEGSKLESSELVIEEVETEYFCKDCGHVFKPERTDHHLTENPSCPECHSDDLEMIAGNELMIKDISYE